MSRSGIVPPPGLQEKPALAAVGDSVLAVWTDGRADPPRLYGARWPGALPDTGAVPLAAGNAPEVRAAVAANAAWTLLAWESWEGGAPRLRARGFASDAPLGPHPGVEVAGAAGACRRPAVALRGDRGVLVFEDERDGPGNLRLSRFDRVAGLLDPDGTPFPDLGGTAHWARVVAGLDGFLVVWSEWGGAPTRVVARRLDADGLPQGSARVISDPALTADTPDAVPSGDGWLVVWQGQGGGGGDLVGVRLAADGTPAAAPATLLADPALQYGPRVAAGAGAPCLVWTHQTQTGRSLRAADVAGDGSLAPPAGIEIAAPALQAADAAVVAGPVAALVAFRVPDPGDADDLHGIWLAPGPLAVESGLLTGIPEEVTGVGETPTSVPPLRALGNPFRGSIRLEVAPGAGSVEVYDAAGRRVRRLLPREGRVVWDGRDEAGTDLPPGIYFAGAGGGAIRLVKLP